MTASCAADTDGSALLSWPWKLIQENRRSARYQLYDLENDPKERRDLVATQGRDAILAGFLQQ